MSYNEEEVALIGFCVVDNDEYQEIHDNKDNNQGQEESSSMYSKELV